MVRAYNSNATLHLVSEKGSIAKDATPSIIAMVINGSSLTYYNITRGTTSTSTLINSIFTSNKSSGIVFFGSMYGSWGSLSERWTGNCYWMFCARRVLSEDEINKVVEYNEALTKPDTSGSTSGDTSEWVTLTSYTDRSIPMQTFRIDATDPNTSGSYFITFSATPNYVGNNATITVLSICLDEGVLYDNGRKTITSVATHIEGNIYEYTFSQVVYFAGGEVNAPLSQVQYKPM